MAYRFKLDELSAKGFRRIAKEQFQRAAAELGRTEMAAVNVHETRKVVKRLKSLLRLMRPAIPEKTFRNRYRRISKIGAALAPMRDRHVMFETIGKLETRFGPEGIGVLQPLRPLVVGSKSLMPERSDSRAGRRVIVKTIIEAQKFEKIAFKAKGFEALSAGVEETYRAGRRNFARAYKRPSDDAFHELRKAVQWHWRQMALISRAWPEYFEARIAAARQLAEILGEDHDLAILEAEVRKHSLRLPEDAGPIEHLIHLRKGELRQAAYPYAERLFVEKPGHFVRRISAYWTSSQKMRQLNRDAKADGDTSKHVNTTKSADAGPRLGTQHRGEITQPAPVAPPPLIR
jgi:CHAD domain-containing protein